MYNIQPFKPSEALNFFSSASVWKHVKHHLLPRQIKPNLNLQYHKTSKNKKKKKKSETIFNVKNHLKLGKWAAPAQW